MFSSFQNEDRPFLFRIDTSSYERCIADLCGSMKERQYIMTANRILKARLQTLRDKENSLASVIDSYHLKTIAYSVIYEETMRGTPSKIAGVAEAFDLQILELKKRLKDRCLPDFFLGKKAPKEIFPGSILNDYHIEHDLVKKFDSQVLSDASKNGFSEFLGFLNEVLR